MISKEKAAGMLDTSATADTKQSQPIIAASNEQGNDEKAVATLIACFALAGFAVHRLSCGGFLVAKWNLTKHCPDVRALAGFAELVGARR